MDITQIIAILGSVLTIVFGFLGIRWRAKLIKAISLLKAIKEATDEASPDGRAISTSESVLLARKLQELFTE